MPRPAMDITGEEWNGIIAIQRSNKRSANRMFYWRFRCHCGTEFETLPQNIRNGSTSSCGCIGHPTQRRPHAKELRTELEQDTFVAWDNMKRRCDNPNHPQWNDYGGRGINVCDSWQKSFDNFVRDVGIKPYKGLSIDRIDNDGNYEPGNVRWATSSQQNYNKARRQTLRAEGRRILLELI